jgi:hypothetical protein
MTRGPRTRDDFLRQIIHLWLGQPLRFLTARPIGPASPHSGDVPLILLTVLLLVAAWPFFSEFALLSVLAATLLSVAVRIYHHHHPTHVVERRTIDRRLPQLNVSAIHIGGDAGGLIFTVGSLAIIILSVPTLRWFVIGSVACAAAIAAAVVAWRKTHPIWSRARDVRLSLRA